MAPFRTDAERRKAYHREYYAANAERLRREAKNRRPEPAACAAAYKEYYEDNKAHLNGRSLERYYRAKYGIGTTDKQRLVEGQGGLCGICTTPVTTGLDACIDHCHVSGKIRGILCRRCNLGLGHFNDRPETMRAAAAYIERSLGKAPFA